MKNFLKQFSRIKLLGIVVTLLLPFTTQAASLINLGTLDVKPVIGGEYINLNLTPGQSVQQQLRISNFSPNPMHLQIYVADAAENSAHSFVANNQNKLSRDVSPWISLPAQQLDLASGATKILSVNIQTPTNAGVGLHTGAIMVSQKISGQDDNIVVEKGVRIYANVKGTAVPAISLAAGQTSQSDLFLNYSGSLSNSGNTDLNGSFTLKLLDQNNQVVGTQEQSAYLKPGEVESINLAVEKPQFGIYHAVLSNNLINNQIQDGNLGMQIFFPPYSLPITIGITLLLGALMTIRKKFSLSKFSFSLPDFSALFRTLALEKVGIFFAILLAAGFLVFNVIKLPSSWLRAAVIGNNQSYQTTIKWGNLAKNNLPDTLRTDWQGSLKFENAIISVKDYLNQETSDQFTLNSDRNTLFFKNTTGPDNDGIDLIVTPTSSAPINITYKNNLSHEEVTFPLENTLKQTKSFDFKAHQITFSSIPTSAHTEAPIIDQNATGEIGNLQSSAEIAPVIQADQLASEVKVLQGVIADLPATPETLSDYILNSNYVQEVSSENLTTTVKADPALINALQDAPNTIADITSSKELNFIFVPNQKVRFAAQNFSFTENKTVTQNLGQIIFVQNKTNAWNTYLSVSNLVSVSGRGSIPTSNITVTPGAIRMISGSNPNNFIEAGPQKTLSDPNDSVLLANIAPQNGEQATFSLNPQFSVLIPVSTFPGIYRAQVTIKVL